MECTTISGEAFCDIKKTLQAEVKPLHKEGRRAERKVLLYF